MHINVYYNLCGYTYLDPPHGLQDPSGQHCRSALLVFQQGLCHKLWTPGRFSGAKERGIWKNVESGRAEANVTTSHNLLILKEKRKRLGWNWAITEETAFPTQKVVKRYLRSTDSMAMLNIAITPVSRSWPSRQRTALNHAKHWPVIVHDGNRWLQTANDLETKWTLGSHGSHHSDRSHDEYANLDIWASQLKDIERLLIAHCLWQVPAANFHILLSGARFKRTLPQVFQWNMAALCGPQTPGKPGLLLNPLPFESFAVGGSTQFNKSLKRADGICWHEMASNGWGLEWNVTAFSKHSAPRKASHPARAVLAPVEWSPKSAQFQRLQFFWQRIWQQGEKPCQLEKMVFQHVLEPKQTCPNFVMS